MSVWIINDMLNLTMNYLSHFINCNFVQTQKQTVLKVIIQKYKKINVIKIVHKLAFSVYQTA